ncbi:HDOD domain-containing protein [Paraglaciecola sp. 2405UD69-4]|uniref:HDOD domain-containing protein n=1 Tax=Paraglaciecola sp. 2405UD69-4 TaxID=3391836 RepID=UPI0039C97EDD
MNQALPIENLITERFNDLFLDLKQAQQNLLFEGKPQLSRVEIEQSKTKRSLLRVEKQAIQEKDLNTKSEQSFLNSITAQINEEVERQLIEVINDTDYLYEKILGFDDAVVTLLDMAGLKAATISKIEPLACDVPWLYNDLLKMINQPKYRRVDSKGKVVVVDTIRAAISFFGIENLIIVVTCLAFRRALPQITDPYPTIKIRIWEEALATALASKKMAHTLGLDPNHAFCLGMFQQLGKIVITKLYFRIFDSVQIQALKETEGARQHEEHSALLKLSPTGAFLNELITRYGLKTSSQLIARMNFKRIFISQAMQARAENKQASKSPSLSEVLAQSHGYAQYRILKHHKLIDLQQSKDFIRTLNMPKGSLEILKTVDLRTLNLTFSAE